VKPFKVQLVAKGSRLYPQWSPDCSDNKTSQTISVFCLIILFYLTKQLEMYVCSIDCDVTRFEVLSGVAGNSIPRRCYAVSICKYLSTFRRTVMHSSSGSSSRKIKVLESFETLITFRQSTWRSITEDVNLRVLSLEAERHLRNSTLDPSLNDSSAVRSLTPHFFQIHSIIVLPSIPLSSMSSYSWEIIVLNRHVTYVIVVCLVYVASCWPLTLEPVLHFQCLPTGRSCWM
jgi:hypothetical protein